jgi:Ferritin-like domain
MARHQKHDEIAISEGELDAMTNTMTEAHHESLPRLEEAMARWGDQAAESRGFNRRSFLARAGLVTGGIAFVSTAGGAGAAVLPRLSRIGATPAARPLAASLDVKVAALAASLENLAVATYEAGLKAATAGKIGTVPPAVATFVETAMAQHTDHAAAWNAIIVSAGFHKITAPNAAIQPSITAAFAKVSNVPGLAKLALSLEEAAAATYLEALDVASSQRAIETAATIHPVEMQHAAILNFVLGTYPVPVAFAGTSGAAPLSAVPALHI